MPRRKCALEFSNLDAGRAGTAGRVRRALARMAAQFNRWTPVMDLLGEADEKLEPRSLRRSCGDWRFNRRNDLCYLFGDSNPGQQQAASRAIV